MSEARRLRRKIGFRKIKACASCGFGHYKEGGVFFCSKFPEIAPFADADRLESRWVCDFWKER